MRRLINSSKSHAPLQATEINKNSQFCLAYLGMVMHMQKRNGDVSTYALNMLQVCFDARDFDVLAFECHMSLGPEGDRTSSCPEPERTTRQV